MRGLGSRLLCLVAVSNTATGTAAAATTAGTSGSGSLLGGGNGNLKLNGNAARITGTSLDSRLGGLPVANIGGVHDFPSNYSLWLAAGGRGLDTALIYDHTDHDVQWALGNAVRRSGLARKEVYVTTKVPCCPAKGVFVQGFDADAWCANHQVGNRTQTIAESVEHDLGQLDLPEGGYVDLLLLHWPCGTVEQTLAAYKQLEPFVHSGKARAIGVSNFNATMLDAVVRGSAVKPTVNQCGFSIGRHNQTLFGSDQRTLEQSHMHGVTYEAYSPLGGLSNVDVLHNSAVRAVAVQHNVSTAQVALRWVAQQGVPFVTSSTSEAYDREDLDIFHFNLTGEQMAILAAI